MLKSVEHLHFQQVRLNCFPKVQIQYVQSARCLVHLSFMMDAYVTIKLSVSSIINEFLTWMQIESRFLVQVRKVLKLNRMLMLTAGSAWVWVSSVLHKFGAWKKQKSEDEYIPPREKWKPASGCRRSGCKRKTCDLKNVQGIPLSFKEGEFLFEISFSINVMTCPSPKWAGRQTWGSSCSPHPWHLCKMLFKVLLRITKVPSYTVHWL